MDSFSLAIKAFPCHATVEKRMSLAAHVLGSLGLGMVVARREMERREFSKTSKLHVNIALFCSQNAPGGNKSWSTFQMRNSASEKSLRRSKSSFSCEMSETMELYCSPPNGISHGSTARFYWLKFAHVVLNTIIYALYFEFYSFTKLLLRNRSLKFV